MDIQIISKYTQTLNDITRHITGEDGQEQVEVWFARELQSVLGYTRWENFVVAIGRAVESCKSQNINVDDHFCEVTKMISLAKGAKREIQDFMLTRYACYLIAQNGDPKKEEIAFAQRGIRPENLPPAEDIKKIKASTSKLPKDIAKE